MADPTYAASDRALLTELGDGTGVLLDMDSQFYFSLNETAIFLWKLLAEDKVLSRDQLARSLSGEFDVTLQEASSDVDAILETLASERLIKAR